MLLGEFDFPFEPSLIADHPVEPRDQARLLVVQRDGGPFLHRRVADLPSLLSPGDLVVVNDTKVMAVRVIGQKRPSGGRLDVLFVRDLGDNTWEVLLKGRVREGQVIELGDQVEATVSERSQTRTTLRVPGVAFLTTLTQHLGVMPLPPYIKRLPCEADRRWYQTVFAEREGAIAAPTAGLHFTPNLVDAFRARGIEVAQITLHVGPGTFQPVTTDQVQDHRMGSEEFEVSARVADSVRRTKAAGGRIVAVGTTVVRSLEAAAHAELTVKPTKGETALFIVPGYRYRVVDAVMTNFHLPRTTLLMLVSAFAGMKPLREAYAEAVKAKYRFYSYGDAMLIL